jgi:hypothetical protein
LISLAQACHVLDRLFTREERATMHARVAAIVRGEALGKAVQETVTAINAAVIAAVATTVVVSKS